MELNLDEQFHPAYGVFELTARNYVYYRGFDSTYPAISERPAYFGTLTVAESYAKKYKNNVQMFTNTKTLRLVDVRFMKDLLRRLFERNNDNDVSILSTVLSFGICSLAHQIQLAKIRFDSIKDSNDIQKIKDYKTDENKKKGFTRLYKEFVKDKKYNKFTLKDDEDTFKDVFGRLKASGLF